ncbi:MAG: hypothetical protein JNK76_12010 [Planctomycetales bacterium]|nr:hypothetical protein [Planctomycetales bacterium]MBN8624310.1 hypothetical protein [Planctomycetota bacterium]
MLFNQRELTAIQAGKLRVVFRRWRRQSVNVGSTVKTRIGVMAIDDVRPIAKTAIDPREAVASGFESPQAMLKILETRPGKYYRVEVSYAGEDPRIELRETTKLSTEELEGLRKKLARFDAASTHGPWTRLVLETIRMSPHTPAVELARRTGFERDWLKLNIRKLKNLGLTISHHPGYELSPRGKVVLKALERAQPL